MSKTVDQYNSIYMTIIEFTWSETWIVDPQERTDTTSMVVWTVPPWNRCAAASRSLWIQHPVLTTTQLWSKRVNVRTKMAKLTDVCSQKDGCFPKVGVHGYPPTLPILKGFPLKTIQLLGYPHLWKSPCDINIGSASPSPFWASWSWPTADHRTELV